MHNSEPMAVVNKEYGMWSIICRELAPCTISLTGDRAQGYDSKQNSNYIFFAMKTN